MVDDKRPRCEAHYKNSNGIVLAGQRCRKDAVLAVKLEMVSGEVHLCVRHYRQWCNEPLSKNVNWSSRDLVSAPPKKGAGNGGET